MKIALLGASGFVGRHLASALRARGDLVTTSSLRDLRTATGAAANADALVNLAGEPVAQRWSMAAKTRIRTSRVDAPRALIDAFAGQTGRPKTYVTASAIGYYGTSVSATFDETSTPGNDFLADVCVEWEREADRAAALGIRVAKIRTGLALGCDGGALAKLLPIFKFGVGGIVGSGTQWYSWIHIDDLVGIYLHAIDGTDGVLNATAPNPVPNSEFTKALGAAMHRPAVVPVPSLALKLLLGEGALVVTQGQRVLPTRTLATGYRFAYETVDSALAAIVRR